MALPDVAARSQPAGPSGDWTYKVVHSLPGRVRLRILSADPEDGRRFADRLARHPDVSGVRWTSAARSLTVHFEPGQSFAGIVHRLPSDLPAPSADGESPQRPLWQQFLLPAVSLAAGLSGAGLPAQLALGVCSIPTAKRALRGLVGRRLTIDVLDATAISLLLATGDVLAAGATIALLETGERIRQRASGRARRVLRAWMGADPAGVRVLRPGTEPRLPMPEITVGERVVVYAGETVPVDGIVIDGSGLVDTRTWTGEALPRDVRPPAQVLAGSSMVDGRIVIDVTATGEQTRAGRLAAALEDAIAANTKVYERARRIADMFVVPAFAISGAAWFLTRDFGRVISILIIDFGTGIRLALPTTVLSTMISGAREGILFKQGQSIDDLAGVDTIVFDKTGTLTTGNPRVVGVVAEPGFEANAVLRLAASAEGHVPHPLARAIRRAARKQGLELAAPSSVHYVPGGVRAEIEGRSVLIGDRRLLESRGIAGPAHEAAESSVAFVAVDGKLAARIRLHDTIKATARDAIANLRRLGVRELILATGDHAAAARAVSRQLGLDGYRAHMMPEDKVALVRELRDRGRVVALVGDGINDATAMAAADIGIAVPRGADMAREAADVVLLEDELNALVRAIGLARSAQGIVRENVGLVAAPNAVGLALAVGGRLTPLAAALVNNGSTLFATGNGLRPLLALRR